MESETNSEKKTTMSEVNVETSRVIKRNISLGNMKIKIMVLLMIVIQTILMKIMQTNIIQEKEHV